MSNANPRVYTTFFSAVSIAAAQDIFSLAASASNGIEIHWIHLESTNTSAAPLAMVLKRASATFTPGSGGSTPAKSAVDSGNTKAAQSTAHANDTTPGTTTGAFSTLASFQWDTVLPWDFLPPPEDRPAGLVSEAFVLNVPSTPTAVTVSGYVMWAESP